MFVRSFPALAFNSCCWPQPDPPVAYRQRRNRSVEAAGPRLSQPQRSRQKRSCASLELLFGSWLLRLRQPRSAVFAATDRLPKGFLGYCQKPLQVNRRAAKSAEIEGRTESCGDRIIETCCSS